MSDIAQDAFERHEHLQQHPEDGHARRAGVVVGVLAALLAVSEMQERTAQSAYLAHHVGAADEYAFYQARLTRASVMSDSATVLDALPQTPQTAKAAADLRAEAKRLTEDSERGNGSRQIQARAKAEETARDAAFHRYEWYEIATSALQIAIVLTSVSVVTRLAGLMWTAAGIGALAAALAGAVAAGAV
jgi:hypothetical protein